jgi:DNA-binding MarR family transcriptional regulator
LIVVHTSINIPPPDRVPHFHCEFAESLTGSFDMLADKQISRQEVAVQATEAHPAPARTPDPLPVGDHDTVGRLQFALARSSRLLRETATGGLTPTQLAVLGVLLREGPRQLTELAAVERINPTLLSRVVGRLEEDGLVKRSAQEQDRRAFQVSITDAGRALAEGLRHERCIALADRLARLDPTHAETLFAALPALEALADQLATDRKD